MIIYLRRKKMLFIFAKNGLYYQFLSNVPLEQNEPKLLHEYGLSPEDLRHKERVEVVCPMHVTMPFVYKLLDNKYQRIISMYDLRRTLEEYYGPIGDIEGAQEVIYWFNSTRIENE